MIDFLLTYAQQVWWLTAAMAPYLLLGFLVAGLLSVFVSPAWMERHLGGRGTGPVWKAALLGVPLPLCSCGVIPVAASMRRHGASRAATTSFLLSTPQTGVDSIAVTGAVLGPVFAVVRPVVALITGIVGGTVVQAVAGREPSVAGPAAALPDGGGSRLRAAVTYGFATLPRDIGRALVIGILLGGLITTLVPAGALSSTLGGGVVPVLVMMAVGIPLYVCATGSVPLAAGFIHAGVAPGAALAFLIAGPATNAAAVTTLLRVLGKRTAAVYLATVAVSAAGAGILLNLWQPDLHLRAHVGEHAHETIGWFLHVAAVVLVAVLAWSHRPGRRAECGCETTDPVVGGAGKPERIELAVTGMHCTHCQGSVDRALREQPGVERVEVDLQGGQAVVVGHDLDAGAMVRAIGELGFEARPRR